MTALTHLDETGAARMVDVGDKPVTRRTAIAEGHVSVSADALAALEGAAASKGDVLAVARVAGIMAAKRTSELIPLCHPLPLRRVTLDLAIEPGGVRATATCITDDKTGVEMEALTAVSIALLTIYDMLKAVDRAMVVSDIRLIEKRGGRSGDWRVSSPGDVDG